MIGVRMPVLSSSTFELHRGAATNLGRAARLFDALENPGHPLSAAYTIRPGAPLCRSGPSGSLDFDAAPRHETASC